MPTESAEKSKAPPPERVYCNGCGQRTKHSVLFVHKQADSELYEGKYEIWWENVYTVLECGGCERVCMRRRHYFSESGPDDIQEEYFPPATFRDVPEWAERLAKHEQDLLREVYRALAAGSSRLATMGARALVDMFIVRKIGDTGGFKEKLEALDRAGYVSTRNREVLDAALEAGNASAHRGYTPSKEHLTAVMDIVENLLHGDLLHEDAGALRKAVPPRQPRSKE